ncbi:MAG: hypothetical protein LBM69_02605 [Lachnospiraceae bacterium]|jgi:hypothetical protein|nr:hypothetical protein [Lachnospiraceae bacterium]
MTSEQLFIAIGNIADRFIEEDAGETTLRDSGGIVAQKSPRKIRWMGSLRWFKVATPLAACLVIAVVLMLPQMTDYSEGGNTMAGDMMEDGLLVTSSESAQATDSNAEYGERDEQSFATIPLIFNTVSSKMEVDKILAPLHFWHQLDETQLAAVFPGVCEAYMVSALANYDGEAMELVNVVAQVSAPALIGEDTRVWVQIAEGEPNYIYDYYSFEPSKKESEITVINEIPVTAGIWSGISGGKEYNVYIASFMLGDLGYFAELSDYDSDATDARELFTAVINHIIGSGSADISGLDDPEADGIPIPKLRDDGVTLSEAMADPDFGKYIPTSEPSGFDYESGRRFINQNTDDLSIHWTKNYNYLTWCVSAMNESLQTNVTSVSERENYDLSLYPIPTSQSVPDERREIVTNPIFQYDEMTLDTVYARARYIDDDAGDEPGYRINFNVLIDDALIQISAKGLAPEDIWAILQSIAQ